MQEGFEASREREAQSKELARIGTWVDSWIKFDPEVSNYLTAPQFVGMMYEQHLCTNHALCRESGA